MPKKSPAPLPVLPLQRVTAEIITDPAEIAAMEEMRKRLKRGRRSKPFDIAPPQFVVAEVITDPAEIAAMERMRKRLKQKRNRAKTKGKRGSAAAKKKP